jgi:hypothetical protein
MTEDVSRLPGNLSHLQRLIGKWASDVEGAPVSVGRLQRLVGVSVIAAMLDGLRTTDGVEQLAFKGGQLLSCGSG